jgi:hypothetical protein
VCLDSERDLRLFGCVPRFRERSEVICLCAWVEREREIFEVIWVFA